MPNKNNRKRSGGKKARIRQRQRERRRDKRPTDIEKQAKRDVGLAYGPQFKSLKREKQAGKREYQETDTRLQDIYGDLSQALAPLYGNYDAAAQDIMGDYGQAMQGVSDTFTQAPVMGTEGASQAAANLFGTIQAGGNALLSNDRMRNLGYQTSAQRQGALEQKDARFDALEVYRDLLDDIRNRRLDLRGDMPTILAQRLDELKEQRFGRRLQRRELDIAEENYRQINQLNERGFRAGRRDTRSANRRANRQEAVAAQVMRDEDADAAARRALRITKGKLANVNSRLASVNAAIGPVVGGADSPVDSGLYRQRKRLTRRKRRIKQRRRGARRELRD